MKKPKGAYRMGWFIVMFDLPVTTKKERKAAQKFRKDLLDMGYLMLQFSVYARCAVTFDRKNKIISELENINPHTGNIKCFFITDTQWGQGKTLHAEQKKSPYIIDAEQDGEQLKFW